MNLKLCLFSGHVSHAQRNIDMLSQFSEYALVLNACSFTRIPKLFAINKTITFFTSTTFCWDICLLQVFPCSIQKQIHTVSCIWRDPSYMFTECTLTIFISLSPHDLINLKLTNHKFKDVPCTGRHFVHPVMIKWSLFRCHSSKQV